MYHPPLGRKCKKSFFPKAKKSESEKHQKLVKTFFVCFGQAVIFCNRTLVCCSQFHNIIFIHQLVSRVKYQKSKQIWFVRARLKSLFEKTIKHAYFFRISKEIFEFYFYSWKLCKCWSNVLTYRDWAVFLRLSRLFGRILCFLPKKNFGSLSKLRS